MTLAPLAALIAAQPATEIPVADESVPAIKITPRALQHIIATHTATNPLNANKSTFFEGIDIIALVQQAALVQPYEQVNNNFARICDAGHPVGIDRASGLATSLYTVVTDPSGNLVTMFPGQTTEPRRAANGR